MGMDAELPRRYTRVEVRDANEFDPRGTHRVRTTVELFRLLRLSSAPPVRLEFS
jgi:hypothetical protein